MNTPQRTNASLMRVISNLYDAAGIPRLRNGSMSFSELNRITGVDASQFRRWKNDVTGPSVESLDRLARALAPHTELDPETILDNLYAAAGVRSDNAVQEIPSPGHTLEPIAKIQDFLAHAPPERYEWIVRQLENTIEIIELRIRAEDGEGRKAQ